MPIVAAYSRFAERKHSIGKWKRILTNSSGCLHHFPREGYTWQMRYVRIEGCVRMGLRSKERVRERGITWQKIRILQMKRLDVHPCERIHWKAWIKRIRGQKPWFARDFWDSHWLPDRRYEPLWALWDKLQNSSPTFTWLCIFFPRF